jgi:magnesium chelatase family protein
LKWKVDFTKGVPQFIIVGLPDAEVKESKERIHSAIKNSGFSFPPGKIRVNLAPADIKKEGFPFGSTYSGCGPFFVRIYTS